MPGDTPVLDKSVYIAEFRNGNWWLQDGKLFTYSVAVTGLRDNIRWTFQTNSWLTGEIVVFRYIETTTVIMEPDPNAPEDTRLSGV